MWRWLVVVALLVVGACTTPDPPPPVPAPTPAPAPSVASAPDRFERMFYPTGDLFEKKRPARSGDWLARFPEKGQSFLRYQSSSPVRPTQERTRIVLQPLGKFDAQGLKLMATLREYLAIFFALPVDVGEPLALPKKGQRVRDEGGKRWVQHYTHVLLDEVLRPRVPRDAIVLVGVTLEDLYPDPKWNYVFGEASLDERVGVHSLARFFPDFWGEPDTPAARKKGLLRSVSVLAHETGHAFGMLHCTEYECLMNGSNSLDELDRQFSELCPVCLRKLAWNIGFDPVKRYEKLGAFYRREGLDAMARWTDRRLAAIRR